jgi:NhaC family Na+:H+ antiporter
MAVTLGVETVAYVPWAVLNYTGILFAILLAYTGIGIAQLDEEEGHDDSH